MQDRYYHTLYRIGTGLASLGALLWLLWPGETWEFGAEPLVAFVGALAVWLFTEIKQSEEVIYRDSTPNDIRFGRELVSYGTWIFRELLKDHNYHRGIHPRYLTEASFLVHETEIGIAHFQDKKIQRRYLEFFSSLKEFVDYFGQHSTPERFGSVMLQSIIPASVFDNMSISDQHQTEIDDVNRLASESWEKFLPLIDEIKTRIPEVFDEPIKGDWFRSPADRFMDKEQN